MRPLSASPAARRGSPPTPDVPPLPSLARAHAGGRNIRGRAQRSPADRLRRLPPDALPHPRDHALLAARARDVARRRDAPAGDLRARADGVRSAVGVRRGPDRVPRLAALRGVALVCWLDPLRARRQLRRRGGRGTGARDGDRVRLGRGQRAPLGGARAGRPRRRVHPLGGPASSGGTDRGVAVGGMRRLSLRGRARPGCPSGSSSRRRRSRSRPSSSYARYRRRASGTALAADISSGCSASRAW